jgi:hypothetical protein
MVLQHGLNKILGIPYFHQNNDVNLFHFFFSSQYILYARVPQVTTTQPIQTLSIDTIPPDMPSFARNYDQCFLKSHFISWHQLVL